MIAAQDIRNVIESVDDFGHELRVRRVLRGHRDGTLHHGGTYIDPVTGKPRQFDLRWHLFQEEGVAINLAIECKNISSDVPIVISGLERRPNESFHYLVESRAGGNFLLGKTPSYYNVHAMGVVRRTSELSGIYPADSFVGKNILRIERSEAGRAPNTTTRYAAAKDREIYDRWSQALASAKDLLLESRYYAHKYQLKHVFTAVLPVVVLPDHALWFAEYDENGVLKGEPSETNQCEFFVGRELDVPPEFPDFATEVFKFSHIHFFTLSGFAQFLLDIRDLGWLNRCFPDDELSAARDERLS
jgi:hypothetical protein